MPKTLRGVFVGEVRDGRFYPDDVARWKRVTTGRSGLRTRVEIGPVPRPRTDPQLAYYWTGIVREVHLWSGQPEDQIHDHLKEEILRPMLDRELWLPLPDGKHLKAKPSTGLLDVDRMNRYIYLCKEYIFTEWGVIASDIDHTPLR